MLNILAQHSLRFCARQGIAATLVFLDLDEFKAINDKFGHAEGDRALVAFADRMRSTYRDTDLCARMGGDEFVVLLTDTSKQQAEEVIARFSGVLEKTNRESNRGYDLTFSHGIVAFDPERHRTIEALLADGDSRMYQTKKSKRDHR